MILLNTAAVWYLKVTSRDSAHWIDMPELETVELGFGSFWYIHDIEYSRCRRRLVVLEK